jgi:hypothetical protein
LVHNGIRTFACRWATTIDRMVFAFIKLFKFRFLFLYVCASQLF